MLQSPILRINIKPRLSKPQSNNNNINKPKIRLPNHKKQNQLGELIEKGTIWKKFLIEDIKDQKKLKHHSSSHMETSSITQRQQLSDITNYCSIKTQNTQRQSYKAKPLQQRYSESIQEYPEISQFQCLQHYQSCREINYNQIIETYKVNRQQRIKKREQRRAKTRLSSQMSDQSFQSEYQSISTKNSKYNDEQIERMEQQLQFYRAHYNNSQKPTKNYKTKRLHTFQN